MVIDIDSFLNRYNQEGGDAQVPAVEKKAAPLDFQKDVEDRIRSEEAQGLKANYEFLKSIYEEVKKFDEDLPNKFLGIEGKGSQALKSLGDRYSSEYLKKIQENAKLVSNKINSLLVQVDNLVPSNDFHNMVIVYEDLIKAYRLYPREILNEKIRISNQIRKREIIINEKVDLYKEKKLKLIKQRLTKVPGDMKKMLNPGYGKEIEEGINKLDYLLNSIPKLFMSDLTQERIALSKMLIVAEEYLQTEYLREYEEKLKVINELFENFHQHYLKGNLDGVLMVYDEILYQFEEVPEVFLDKKVEIYKKINSLYASINKLMIKSNVARFLETYNYSRSIEEVRDYLNHIKSIGKVNAKTLSILREKLKLIPDKYHEEKANIEKEIVYLVGAYNERKQYIDKKLVEKYGPGNESGPVDPNIARMERQDKKEEVKPQYVEVSLIDDSHLKRVNSINQHKLKEVNLYFERLKKSNNPQELKLIYKKIILYLNSSGLDRGTVEGLVQKVHRIIQEKDLK